jgi:hypothetical protein
MTAAFRPDRHLRRCPLAVVIGILLCGCATYSEEVQDVHEAFYEGRLDEAAAEIEAEIEDEESDRDILELEQAIIMQALGRYGESARLLMIADERMEVLDYTNTPVEDVADAIFGFTTAPYRVTPTEKLLINSFNMVNFLALGEYEEAAVEARRARILMTQEESDFGIEREAELAWALAGVSFEMARRWGEAEDAWREVDNKDLRSPPPEGMGSVLVVVQNGKAPLFVEGVYFLFVGNHIRRLQLPVMVPRPRAYTRATVSIGDERDLPVPVLLDIQAEVMEAYDDIFPRLLAAAVIQMLPRTAAAEVIRQSLRDSGDDAAKMVLIEALALGVENLIAELIPVDTRGWTLLPADIRVARVHVEPGNHDVIVDLGGGRARRIVTNIDVKAGQLAVVNVVTATTEGYQSVGRPEARDLTDTADGIRALRLVERTLLWREVLD